MLALRQPGRSLLARTIARVLIAALVFALVPFDASAATRSPALAQAELPELEPPPLPAPGEVLYCVVAVAEANILTKSAFGELLAHTGTDPQPYAFTGEPLDPSSGWQYHRARWMDPKSEHLMLVAMGIDSKGEKHRLRSLPPSTFHGAQDIPRRIYADVGGNMLDGGCWNLLRVTWEAAVELEELQEHSETKTAPLLSCCRPPRVRRRTESSGPSDRRPASRVPWCLLSIQVDRGMIS